MRSQLARGLRLLRECLPRGLALGAAVAALFLCVWSAWPIPQDSPPPLVAHGPKAQAAPQDPEGGAGAPEGTPPPRRQAASPGSEPKGETGGKIAQDGVSVSGVVLDAEGVPVEGVLVRFLHTGGGPRVGPTPLIWARTGAAGRFETPVDLAVGEEYRVTVEGGWRVEHPRQIALSPEQDRRDLVIRVGGMEQEPVEILAGVVVDEQGRPVRRARVSVARGMGDAVTDREGRFRIPKHPMYLESAALTASARGYDSLTTEERFAWGREDIRLTLRRAAAVEVEVLAEDDRTPVERFHLRLFRGRALLPYHHRDGHHDGGRVALSGVARGAYWIHVEPRDERLAGSGFLPVEVGEVVPARVSVVLPKRVERSVQVRRADGEPVAGTRVVLADPLGATPDALTMRLAEIGWARPLHHGEGLQLFETTTSATGEAVLGGPDRPGLAVFVKGPGHLPAVVANVALAEEEPLVVTVGAGARLVGQVLPAQVLADKRLQAGLPAAGPVEDGRSGVLPFLVLVRGTGRDRVTFPSSGEPRVVPGEDGTFTVENAPPGTWDLRLTAFRHAAYLTPHGYTSTTEALGTVTLREGETTEVDLDAAFLLHGEVQGRVFHNGKPLAGAALRPEEVYPSRGRTSRREGLTFTTDAEGRFRTRARQGRYRLLVVRPPGPLGNLVRWRFREEILVLPGQTATRTIHLQTGTVRLRLLDTEDRPVSGIEFGLRDAATGMSPGFRVLSPTGGNGFAEGEIPAGTFVVEVRGPDGSEPLTLGQVAPRMGETVEASFRLPAEQSR